ncbi:MAG: putative monooxygenase, FAD-binding [Hydrocarboniphaga sp.]|nr:putative monooxygenase, FAD-binding [Hydrocarboniphaga sp.]
MLEKQQFPRFSIGESLLAQSLALIEQAGLLEVVQAAGFQFKNGAAFAWQDRYAAYNFAQKSSPGPSYTFQVPRAEFDHLLIREAEKLGADVRFRCETLSVDFSDERPRVGWRDADGALHEHCPRFVLDASGFARTLPRLLGLESPSNQALRIALYTQIHDRIPAGAFDRQKILVNVHPEHRDVWYWLIPFSDGRCSIGVVGPAAFMDARSGSLDERLWALQREVPRLKQLLQHAEPVFAAGELRGYSANVSRMAGPGFALLGNAAEFLDPVFSSGVTIALKSAELVAPLVSRQLCGGTVDWQQEFEAPLRYGVETFRAFVDTWYDGRLQDIFFHEAKDTKISRMICSVLAGYAWDRDNPYTGPLALRRLDALARTIRRSIPSSTGG